MAEHRPAQSPIIRVREDQGEPNGANLIPPTTLLGDGLTDYMERAIDRLQYAITQEPDRRIIFVTGSGISRPNVPSTSEMVDLLLAELPGLGGVSVRRIRDLADAEAYQSAARELDLRRGPRGIARVLSRAVGRARLTPLPEPPIEPLPLDGWSLPPAQEALADVIGNLSPQQRGPIFTTNFDPLTEVALSRIEIPCTTIAAPSNSPLNLDSVFGSLPVVHLHGYWLNSATVNTPAQLENPRTGVDSMLRTQFQNAIVVVLGYGGWGDAFMRALHSMVGDGRMAALDCEILWAAYGSEPSIAANPLVRTLVGEVGVNFYWNVDATQFLAGVSEQIKHAHHPARIAFPGWAATGRPVDVGQASPTEITEFTEGSQPSWRVAKWLPRLTQTQTALQAVSEALVGEGDRVIAIVGPTGEGKSLALRQIALDTADQSNVSLIRESGSFDFTTPFEAHLRTTYSTSLLFIDEADLVLSSVMRSLKSSPDNGRVVFVVAMHSQYRERLYALREDLRQLVTQVEFNAVSEDDQLAIATAWHDANILPQQYVDASPADIAAMIAESGYSPQGDSLFGAVLHLWVGDGLRDRVRDLLVRLETRVIRGVSYRTLLGAVAIVQTAWDLYEENMRGMSLTGLGRLCDLSSTDVMPLIIDPLGREVGLSQIGNRVYVRHAAIAEAIVNELLEDGDSAQIARRIGHVGALLRIDETIPASEGASLYNLWSKLRGESAIAAARGSMGVAGLLEARVSYLACLRRNGQLQLASKFAKQVGDHISRYDDRWASERGFWVEFGVIEWKLGHADTAMQLLCFALSDASQSYISLEQLHYGLINCARLGIQIGTRRVAPGADVATAARDLLSILPRGSDQGLRLDSWPSPTESVSSLVRRFKEATAPFAWTA